MNVCFLACFDKTILFNKISKELDAQGINVFWISVSTKWTNYLLENAVSPDNIITLSSEEVSNVGVTDELEELMRLIEKHNSHTLKQVYYMDRILSKKSWKDVLVLFQYIIDKVTPFIKKKNIQIIFGETTAAHEIITAMIAKSINIKFFKPHTVRIPDNRFAFFEGYSEKNIFKVASPDWSEEKNNKFISEYEDNKQKPYYVAVHNTKNEYVDMSYYKTIFKKLKDIFQERNSNFTEKSLYHHLFIEKKYLYPLNRFIILNCLKFYTIKDKRKYVLYTMHVQPEASIDVLGIENNNQYETIKKISSNLPYNYTLLVKAHSSGLGSNTFNSLKKISNIPGVMLVDPYQNSLDILKYVDLVYTVSGTIGMEAAILGVKSVSLSPMFYNKFELSFYDKNPSNIRKYLFLNCNYDKQKTTSSLYSYLQFTHSGFISDPISLPFCTSSENIKVVSKAFLQLINEMASVND